MKPVETKSADVSGRQLPLLDAPRGVTPVIDIPYVRALPTFRRAMRYQWSVAGLEPKDVYDPLGHDKATWSKIDSGTMSFQADKIETFCRVTRNIAVIEWLAFRAGMELKPLRSDLERENADLREQLRLERHDKQVILSAFAQVRAR